MKKNQYYNRRLEKSAGRADGRKYMSLGSGGDIKRLAITQNYFNKSGDSIN